MDIIIIIIINNNTFQSLFLINMLSTENFGNETKRMWIYFYKFLSKEWDLIVIQSEDKWEYNKLV